MPHFTGACPFGELHFSDNLRITHVVTASSFTFLVNGDFGVFSFMSLP
jgi:hypothetical protein